MFLFGTAIFEEAITSLVTKTFKTLLRTATNTLAKAISTGLLVTAVLQSSSVVSLIVLAFVGAGVIALPNAVGVILGTNIWAPLTDILLGNLWLTFSLSAIALPLIWIAGACYLIFTKSIKVKHISKAFFWLGLLFLGLGYMKDSMMALSSAIDFSQYISLSALIYFFIGFVITLIMQSSSATIILVLTAASAGLVNYHMGASLIMGAFLGTTITGVFGALGPSQLKKQAAFSHVFFNFFSAVLGLLFLPWIVVLLQKWFSDVVLWLSIFSLWFKIIWVVLFVPFIESFTHFLQYLFPERPTILGLALEQVDPEITEAGLLAMKKDSIKLLKKVFVFVMHIWHVDESRLLEESFELGIVLSHQKELDHDFLYQEYLRIKMIEESLIAFWAQVKRHTNKLHDIESISQLYVVVSSAVSAAKYMKDVAHNIQSLQETSHDWFHHQYLSFRTVLVKLYKHISQIIDDQYSDEIVRDIVGLIDDIKKADQMFLRSLSEELSHEKADSLDLSDVLHVNRYVYLSSLSLIDAVKKLLLRDEERKILEEI